MDQGVAYVRQNAPDAANTSGLNPVYKDPSSHDADTTRGSGVEQRDRNSWETNQKSWNNDSWNWNQDSWSCDWNDDWNCRRQLQKWDDWHDRRRYDWNEWTRW